MIKNNKHTEKKKRKNIILDINGKQISWMKQKIVSYCINWALVKVKEFRTKFKLDFVYLFLYADIVNSVAD